MGKYTKDGLFFRPWREKLLNSIFLIAFLSGLSVFILLLCIRAQQAVIFMLCLLVGEVLFFVLLLRQVFNDPEYQFYILFNERGVSLFKRQALLVEIPWEYIMDIQCRVGLESSSSAILLDFSSSAFNSLVVLSRFPIPEGYYNENESLNYTQKYPENWDCSWSLYCFKGSKKQCSAIIARIEEYRKSSGEHS